MDPIANMFSQIKNAQQAKRGVVEVPYSKIKMAVLDVLKKNQRLKGFQETMKNKTKKIEIILSEGTLDIQRVSRPGRRVYVGSSRIPKVKTFKGLFILSTPNGLMVGEEARKNGLGGEIIAEVK